MPISRLSLFLMILPGAGFILFFLASAIGMTIAQSFGLYAVVGESRATLAYWMGLFDKTFFDSLFFTLVMGLGSALGALVFAYPLALFLRKARPGSRWISAWVKVPLFVPSLVAAFLIVNILAFHGLLNSTLLYLGLVDQPLRLLNDKLGLNILLVQIWKNLPFQLVILASVLQTIRSDLEDAARNLGASPLAVIRYVVLPLSMPGIMICIALVFLTTFGDYAITRLAGPIYPNSLSVLMFTKAYTLHDWGTAACIGVVIIVTSLVFVSLYVRIVRLIEELAQ